MNYVMLATLHSSSISPDCKLIEDRGFLHKPGFIYCVLNEPSDPVQWVGRLVPEGDL